MLSHDAGYMIQNSHRRCFAKKSILKNFTKFAGRHLCQSLFFNKVAGQETLAQVFPHEFCEIFKNTFFTEHLRATASKFYNWTKRDHY